MHSMRETPEDKQREGLILAALAKYAKRDFQQVMTLGKYKIDGWLLQGNEVKAWAECKWLTKTGFYGLNVPKFIEGCQLAKYTHIPFIYAFRDPEGYGYIMVHDATWPVASTTFRLAGGTQAGRSPNWDDIEPMMLFNERDIVRFGDE